ncbi:MAG: hypothetical protein MZW92_53230 [Comamonadaceae bacterium]|nr:hypothetical protein [Comamonadaceae bacterium]
MPFRSTCNSASDVARPRRVIRRSKGSPSLTAPGPDTSCRKTRRPLHFRGRAQGHHIDGDPLHGGQRRLAQRIAESSGCRRT